MKTFPASPWIARFATTAVLIAVLSGVTPTAVRATAAAEVSYERTVYDGTIWEVSAEGARPLSWAEWSELGFPSFTAAQTDYVRAAPFDTVYAVTWFEQSGEEIQIDISYQQFLAAGQPVPIVIPWIEGIAVHQWDTGPELFAVDPTGSTVRLTYPQWSAAGFPSPTTRANRGFVTMSWDRTGAIAYMCDIQAGRGNRLTYDQWRSLGSPTPLRVERTAAEFLFKVAGSPMSTIYYSGPVVRTYNPGAITSEASHRAVTYQEWGAMGYPAPIVTNLTYPENWWCSSSQPSPWQ
jgi:hypothetical protein